MLEVIADKIFKFCFLTLDFLWNNRIFWRSEFTFIWNFQFLSIVHNKTNSPRANQNTLKRLVIKRKKRSFRIHKPHPIIFSKSECSTFRFFLKSSCNRRRRCHYPSLLPSRPNQLRQKKLPVNKVSCYLASSKFNIPETFYIKT